MGKGEAGRMVKMLAVKEGMSMTKLAEGMGISRQALYGRLSSDMKYSGFKECLEALGYDLYYGKDGKVRKIE